jgi:acetyltransferase
MKHQTLTTFQTNDGQTITVRRILPADVNQLVYIFRNLSEESVYQRFREPATNLSPMRVLETARLLAEDAYIRGMGIIAYADLPGRPCAPIAGARYIRTGKTTAEVAITVIDAFQKKGVGSKLIEIIFEEARRDGIRTLTANVSANNSAVLHMLSRSNYPQKRERFGSEIAIEFDITGEMVNPPAVTAEIATAPGPRPQIRPGHNARNAQPVPGGRM